MQLCVVGLNLPLNPERCFSQENQGSGRLSRESEVIRLVIQSPVELPPGDTEEMRVLRETPCHSGHRGVDTPSRSESQRNSSQTHDTLVTAWRACFIL